jgi:hypothetical protein
LRYSWSNGRPERAIPVPAEPSRVGQYQCETLHPPVNADMFDVDAALGQQFLHIR